MLNQMVVPKMTRCLVYGCSLGCVAVVTVLKSLKQPQVGKAYVACDAYDAYGNLFCNPMGSQDW